VTMLDAGRELDALIALQVFHYTLDYEFADTLGAPTVRELRDRHDEWGMLPHYSTEIGDAWLIVEHFGIRRSPSIYQIARWYCNFLIDGKRTEASAATAPLAICRAALAACGVPS
jgi:hypothetical protein